MANEACFERLYEVMKNDKSGMVPMKRFLTALYQTGLQANDPRLSTFFKKLSVYTATSGINPEDDSYILEAVQLSKDEFHDCVKDSEDLIFRALTGGFVIPEFDRFSRVIENMYDRCRNNEDGKVADYIPQLARFHPNNWGISVCTVDGQRYSIGDTKVPFCLQSTSKALNYALALNEHTTDEVHSHVGQEPSGRSFNALTLDQHNLPHNPLINSGAIATVSLIKTTLSMADRFDYIHTQYKRMAAGEYVGFSNSTFLSERGTADRNFALGYYMQENKVFPKAARLNDTLDLYFQLCSVEVTAESAAVIAATLANGGCCPLTDDEVLGGEAVCHTLSLMLSCGMYDYSGQFAFKVGLPAKSGVSGIVMIVVPNVMGICTWSPPLDELGNSVRGIQFCDDLVSVFKFHMYDSLGPGSNKFDPRHTEISNKASGIVTLLTCAAYGDISCLRKFFNKFGAAAMNQSDYDGRTALHLAAVEGHLEVVDFLLNECKVNPTPRDRFGFSPLDDAKNSKKTEVVELLSKYDKSALEPAVTEPSAVIKTESASLPSPTSQPSPPVAQSGNNISAVQTQTTETKAKAAKHP